VNGATPGFNYYDGKKLTGFEVELAEEIAKKMDLKVEWVVQPRRKLDESPGARYHPYDDPIDFSVLYTFCDLVAFVCMRWNA
jgi:ABC-type amino acid transport substrate-binding protein